MPQHLGTRLEFEAGGVGGALHQPTSAPIPCELLAADIDMLDRHLAEIVRTDAALAYRYRLRSTLV
jgi:hypothetical protein